MAWTLRIDTKQYKAILAGAPLPGEQKKEKENGKSKFNSTRVIIDGIGFDSQTEAAYYLQLRVLERQGLVEYFLRQVPLPCGGGVTLRIDFLVFYSDRAVESMKLARPEVYVDVKGMVTQVYRNKKKQALALQPKLQIVEVMAKDIANQFKQQIKQYL